MKKYFALKSSDGTFVPYFNDSTPLSLLPVVYESKYQANKKNLRVFNKTKEVIEVKPVYGIKTKDTDRYYLYFISESHYQQVLPLLNVLDDAEIVKF